MSVSNLHCPVCGEALTGSRQADGQPLCGDPVCRSVLARKADMTPSAFAHFLQYRSQAVREKNRSDRERQIRLKVAREREQQENLACAAARLNQDAQGVSTSHDVLAVPSCRRSITPLPQRRRGKFRDFLNQLITRTLQARLPGGYLATPVPQDQKDSIPLMEKCCTLCAGACCLAGAEHGFLDEESMAQVMQQHPTWRPRDILKVYLDALPARSYSQSCVYHTSTGCALPRDLRSRASREYFCEGLLNYQKNALDKAERPVVVIVRAREHWDFPNGKDGGIEAAFHLQANGDAA